MDNLQIMNEALKILSRRAHSVQELRTKLFKKGFTRRDIEETEGWNKRNHRRL